MKQCFLLILVFLLTVLPVSAFPDTAVKEVIVNAALDNYELPYTMFLPEHYDETKAYPVMLFLHGAGERGNDNELQLKNAVQNLYDTRPELLNNTILICPQCPNEEQWVDYPWTDGNYSTDEVPESKAMQTAILLLEDVMNTYAADPNRVYIFGLSMGGYGAWDALVRHEKIFAAGVPLCGGGDLSKAELLKEIPIWCSHGTADTAVQFAGTEAMYQAIKEAGGERITFEPIADAGHNIWDAASTNEALLDWLYAQNLTLRYPPETEAVTEAELTASDTDPEKTDSIFPVILFAGLSAAGILLMIFLAIRHKKS